MPFAHIVGQQPIKSRLMASINAPAGVELAQPAFFGEAGLGKTQLALAYAKAMAEKLDCEFLQFNSPEEFRGNDSTLYNQILDWFAASTGVLFIDEIHLFSRSPTVQMEKVQAFLLKCLDNQNRGKLIPYDADNSFTYDKARKVIVVATNYDNRVNPALKSRMDVCNLQHYSHTELSEIAIQMLKNAGMTVTDEQTLSLLALASRGTARPLDNMTQHFARLGVQEITKETAIQTLKELEMFPHGLIRDEIRILEKAVQPVEKGVLKMMLVNLASNMHRSLAFLVGRDFLIPSGTHVKISSKGQKFLSALKSQGFID